MAEKTGIPESITINGVTYVIKETPELVQFMQSVASVEKSKLYSQFETLREQIKNLQGAQVTPDLSVDELVDKLKGTFVTSETLKEVVSGCVKEVVQPVLDATQRTQKNEIDAYREKLITENSATCIPDLVKGNTKEELDAALQESIRIRAAYPSPVAQPQPGTPANNPAPAPNNNAPTTPATPAATPPAAPPATPRYTAPDAGGDPNIKSMSQSEFATKREALLQSLEATYGNGGAM